MELKDQLFYMMLLIASIPSFKHLTSLPDYMRTIREEAPHCYQPQKYFYEILFGTIATFMIASYPIKKLGYQYYMGTLDIK